MLFPIGDENLGRVRAPVVVYTIIAINIAVFLLLQQAGMAGGVLYIWLFSHPG